MNKRRWNTKVEIWFRTCLTDDDPTGVPLPNRMPQVHKVPSLANRRVLALPAASAQGSMARGKGRGEPTNPRRFSPLPS